MSTVAVTMPPAAARFSVRGGERALVALGQGFGVALPTVACRAAMAGERAALWLGPDEWLLLAPESEADGLAAAMNAALGSEPASLVDISHRQLGIAVAGPKAAEALNAFNPLDLDLRAFPAGMCTRTVFGKAEIVLWRRAPEEFRIEAWRSFAPYVLGCLAEACREYGVT